MTPEQREVLSEVMEKRAWVPAVAGAVLTAGRSLLSTAARGVAKLKTVRSAPKPSMKTLGKAVSNLPSSSIGPTGPNAPAGDSGKY